MGSPLNILLTGPPGIGKTTVLQTLSGTLRAAGVPVGGFITREVREHGQRIGFAAEDFGGEMALIARTGWASGPAVGRYRVDVPAFENIALPAIDRASLDAAVIIIDEVGLMELASQRFTARLLSLFALPVPLVASVHLGHHPVTDALKERQDTEVVTVTRDNRGSLPQHLAGRLLAGLM